MNLRGPHLRRMVIRYFVDLPAPKNEREETQAYTATGLKAYFSLEKQLAYKVLHDLEKAGYIRRSSIHRFGTKGRPQVIYVATQRGRQYVTLLERSMRS